MSADDLVVGAIAFGILVVVSIYLFALTCAVRLVIAKRRPKDEPEAPRSVKRDPALFYFSRSWVGYSAVLSKFAFAQVLVAFIGGIVLYYTQWRLHSLAFFTYALSFPGFLFVFFESTIITVRRAEISHRSGLLGGEEIVVPVEEIEEVEARVESKWERKWVVGRLRIRGAKREIYLRGVPDPAGIAELIQFLQDRNDEGVRAWLARPDNRDRYEVLLTPL